MKLLLHIYTISSVKDVYGNIFIMNILLLERAKF